MEKIDLNNYEAYFLDYMEGSLGEEEKHDMFAFLEVHPQLKAEFELDFADASLFPETIVFENKAALKIDEANLIITANTLPDLMIASVEKQLSPAHQAQLNTYIAEKQLESLYATYQNTILRPDLAIAFDEKNKLKQTGGMVISMPFFKRIAAVAAVGLVMVSLAINWNGAPGSTTLNPTSKFVNDQVKTKFLNGFIQSDEIDGDHNVQTNDEGIAPQTNIRIPEDINQQINEINHDVIVEQPIQGLKDSVDLIIPNQTPKELFIVPNEYEFVKIEKHEPIELIPEIKSTEEIYANANIRHEEPYKIVTDAASNLVNKEVKFTRDRDVTTANYVAYSFKLGNFGFEHKKASK